MPFSKKPDTSNDCQHVKDVYHRKDGHPTTSAALINSKLMTRIASTIQLTGWANCVVTTISKAPVTRRIKRLSNIMISCHLLEELYTSHLLSTRNRLIEQNGKRKRLRKDLRACPCQGPLIYHRCPQLFYWIFEFWRPHCSQQPLTLSLKTRLLKRNGLL